MRKTFVILLALFIGNKTMAQLSTSNSSESLMNKSSAIIQRYSTDIEVVDDNNYIVAENLVITVLDEGFLKKFRFSGISNDSTIKELIKSKVYDKFGKKIKNANVEIVNDRNFGGKGGSILSIVCPSSISYPIIIELEYKKISKSKFSMLRWNPLINQSVSVQLANLRLSVSDTSSVAFKGNKIPLTSSYVNEDGLFVFIWEINDFQAIKKGSSEELPASQLPSLVITSKL